jgi:myosin heavy subunit
MVIQGVFNPNRPVAEVAADVRPNSQEQRVDGIFQSMKEMLGNLWRTISLGVQTAGDKISFVTFRALEWINPTLALRAENAFLRIKGIWQGIQDAWTQEEVQNSIEELKVNQYELHLKVQDYDQLVQERDRLKQQNQQLIQDKNLTQAQNQAVHEREQAVVGIRDILTQRNEQLTQQNAQLLREKTEAQQALAQLQAQQQELALKLADAEQQAADLQLATPNQQAIKDQLAVIAKTCQQMPKIGHTTQLDQGLEALLPLLSKQIEDAKTSLAQAKESLTEDQPAFISLLSFERLLGVLTNSLNGIPQILALHRNWQQPVNELLYQPVVEA